MIRFGLISAGGHGAQHLGIIRKLEQEGLLSLQAIVDPAQGFYLKKHPSPFCRSGDLWSKLTLRKTRKSFCIAQKANFQTMPSTIRDLGVCIDWTCRAHESCGNILDFAPERVSRNSEGVFAVHGMESEIADFRLGKAPSFVLDENT